MKKKFALWLKPGDEVFEVLDRIIASLAKEFNAPRFEPHITVAGSIQMPEETIAIRMEAMVKDCEPMTLCLSETGCMDTVYQSLFIHVAPNEALLALRERCMTELQLEHESYMPHISLIYKQLDTGIKRSITERVGQRFDMVFKPDKLYLADTSSRSPEQWKVKHCVPLTRS